MAKKGILGNKYYLYLTEFFSGMSVMAVELGASRLLAPYFSSSQIVWTIIIGTIMIAMALGNIFGGRSADKHPDPDRLYRRLMIAAVWIAAIPVLGRYIILLISGALVLTVSQNFLIIAAFLACMVIFVFPLFLLGTVTPSLVKYTVDSLDDSGRIVGTLGAANTIGSIIGTFLPTFVTIPAVGTAVTFLIFSGILLVLGLVYFISVHRRRALCIIATVLFVVCSIFGHSGSSAFWEKDLVYEGESIYNYLQVKEDDKSVILSTNVLFGVQSIMKKDGGLTGMYYDYALAAPVMAGATEKDTDILVLGMGTGTFALQAQRYFPQSSISGVEIDQKITDLAGKYFELPDTIPVTTYDGRVSGHHDPLSDVHGGVLHHGAGSSEPRRRDGGKHEHAFRGHGKHQRLPGRHHCVGLPGGHDRGCKGRHQPGALCGHGAGNAERFWRKGKRAARGCSAGSDEHRGRAADTL